jgi:hypothetical protein
MGCCGDRRKQLAKPSAIRVTAVAPPTASTPTTSTPMRYHGPVPMVLRGPASNRIYRIATPDEMMEVDPRDARAFQRTGWFASNTSDV